MLQTEHQCTAASKNKNTKQLKSVDILHEGECATGTLFPLLDCPVCLDASIVELLHYANEQDMCCYFRYPL